jgi:hypothetical protein
MPLTDDLVVLSRRLQELIEQAQALQADLNARMAAARRADHTAVAPGASSARTTRRKKPN